MTAQPQLTVFAQKYGPYPGQTFSGLTPIAPQFPGPQTKEANQLRIEKENWQRQACWGFTTRELAQLDVFSSRKLNDESLQNGILPLMARDRWETKPPSPHWKRDFLYRMKDGTGLFTVDNADVWRVLEPCVRLASRHVTSIHCLPWVRVQRRLCSCMLIVRDIVRRSHKRSEEADYKGASFARGKR